MTFEQYWVKVSPQIKSGDLTEPAALTMQAVLADAFLAGQRYGSAIATNHTADHEEFPTEITLANGTVITAIGKSNATPHGEAYLCITK